MALNDETYFRLTLLNGKEILLTDAAKETSKLLSKLSEGLIASDFVSLERVKADREPVYFRKSAILSVELVSKKTIGISDRIWRIK